MNSSLQNEMYINNQIVNNVRIRTRFYRSSTFMGNITNEFRSFIQGVCLGETAKGI